MEVPAEICLPADGVYAAWYVRENADGLSARFPAAVNVGRRPTFYENAQVSLVEAHLLDVDAIDLYGERARLFGVEGAETDEVAAHSPQREIRLDHVHQRHRVAESFYVVFGDRHAKRVVLGLRRA